MTNWLLVLILIGLVGGASALMTVVDTAILAVKVLWWLVVGGIALWGLGSLLSDHYFMWLVVAAFGGIPLVAIIASATAKPMSEEQQGALARFEYAQRGY